jgi:hypothetical protein
MGVVTGEHRYQDCRDPSCQRYACRVWREAETEGYERGRAVGEAEGHAAGYADGTAASAKPRGSG